MPTADEIQRRVEEHDAPRGARRSAAAQQIGELAQRRTVIAEQLAQVEQELGAVLADASDILDISEAARFTDVPAAELARWLNERKPARAKRKRTVGASRAKTQTTEKSTTAEKTATETLRPRPTSPDVGNSPVHAATGVA